MIGSLSGVAFVESVNVGTAVDVPWGQLKRTAIDKRPVEGPVRVNALGVGSDEIADLVNHGREMQAVYAYAGEDLDAWADQREHEIRIDFLFRALTTERQLIPALAAEPRLDPFVRRRLGERYEAAFK